MFSRISIGLAVLLLAVGAGPAAAGTLEDIARDLQPVSGYVVLPTQSEYLIDLDASRGIIVGDLFNVVQPGEKIIHPVTGKVLGTLDASKGLLQVTRLQSGFSHAKAIGDATGIARGDVIRRYDGLRTALWDYTGRGEGFFSQLKAALPALNWQDYAAAQAEKPATPAAPAAGRLDLVVVLARDGLTVRDGAWRVLHAYPVPENLQPTVRTPQRTAPVAVAPYRIETPAQPAAAAPYGVRYEATMPGFKTFGPLGFAAVMADFIKLKGQTLMAATDGALIKLFRITDGMQPAGELQPAGLPQILTLHWWQPDSESLYLAVSGWKDDQISSYLYRYDNGRLNMVKEFLPYVFGSFDRDGDDRRETLLGQTFERQFFWRTNVLQMTLKNGELEADTASFDLPRRFTVSGSMMTDLDGDRQPETVFVRNGRLYVYSGEKQRYKSPGMMGGTLSRIIYEEQPDARETQINFAAFEVPPIAVDLDGDGHRELLSVASESSFLSAPGISPNVRKSWLAVVKYRDGMFVKGSLGEELDVPLQGLTCDDQRVLFVATEPGSIFGKDGGSQMLVFPLAR